MKHFVSVLFVKCYINKVYFPTFIHSWDTEVLPFLLVSLILFLFFLFSGLIGPNPCAATSASTLHKTSTISEVMSPAVMEIFNHFARWLPVLSASSSPTPGLSRSTCYTFIPSYHCQGKFLYPPIAEMSGISVENVLFHPPPSLRWRSTLFSSTWTIWLNSILVTDYTIKWLHL